MFTWLSSLNRHRPLPTSILQADSDKSIRYPDQPRDLAHRPWLQYGLALLPITIVLSSLSFYATLSRHGGLPAPPSLAELVNSNPRLTIQVVTVLGSFLTATVKWGLSRATTLMAQKRFLEFRKVVEIEFWSSIKNGGILWTWTWKWRRNWKRCLGTLTTTALIILCGLMTSGFVSLLSPLPIKVTKAIVGDHELDYFVNSTACTTWLEGVMKVPDYAVLQRDNNQIVYVSSDSPTAPQIFSVGPNFTISAEDFGPVARADSAERVPDYQGASVCLEWHEYKGFTFQTCKTTGQLFDVLEAGRAAMLAHVYSIQPSKGDLRFVSTLGRLGNTRILGSTAGVIPMGPGGIGAFSVHAPEGDPDASRMNKLLATNASYTLTLQGISCDVSCQYVDPSSLPYQLVQATASTANTTCPGGKETSRDIPAGNATLVMDYCPSTNNTWTFNLASSSVVKQATNSTTAKGVYAGIGSMSCSVTPRVRNISATYDLRLGAFVMKPLEDSTRGLEVPPVYFQHANLYTMRVIEAAQVAGSGNIVASIIDNVAVTQLKLPGMQRDDRYPALVASMIKGIYEYQATHLRLILTAYNTSAPQNCTRPVTGSAVYDVIGWEAQRSTLAALIPHGLIGVAIALLVSLAVWIAGDLKVFDPTSAVSLIATASAGGVHFDAEVVGEADDEVVRDTAVRYQEVGKSEPTRWGLAMKGESGDE